MAIASEGAPVEEGRLRRAIHALRHRGPDGEGTWIASDGRVGLGHTRLSVIDLETGVESPLAGGVEGPGAFRVWALDRTPAAATFAYRDAYFGSIDVRHLTAGATLFLPVGVEGALFSAGDGHAAQGDGEVCGSAIETGMEIALRLGVRRDLRVAAPQLVAPSLAPAAEGPVDATVRPNAALPTVGSPPGLGASAHE